MDINSPTPLPTKDYPGTIQHYYKEDGRYYFDTENSRLEVKIVTDQIIRFRFNSEYFAKDFCYALDLSLREQKYSDTFKDNETDYHLSTACFHILINKTNLKIRIENLNGEVVCEDENGYHWEPNPGYGGNYIYCSKHITPKECFYGLGDKPCD